MTCFLHHDEMGEYLLVTESEKRLSDLEFDSDNETYDCDSCDDVVNGDSDDIIQGSVW
jgi:hypothetical protein